MACARVDWRGRSPLFAASIDPHQAGISAPCRYPVLRDGRQCMSLFAALRCGLLNGMVSRGSPKSVACHHPPNGWQRSSLLLVALMLAGLGVASPAPAYPASEDSAWHEF